MPNLLHMHWLWIFGALWFGIALGWATYRLAAARWSVRPVHVAIGAAVALALLVIAHLVPVRYGYRLEVGVDLAIVGAIGCFVGWALRDIAEFTPAATRPAAPAPGNSSEAVPGSYLFRDALTGMGAGSAYMRATTGHAGHATAARARPVPSAALARPGSRAGRLYLPDGFALRRSDHQPALRARPGPAPALELVGQAF